MKKTIEWRHLAWDSEQLGFPVAQIASSCWKNDAAGKTAVERVLAQLKSERQRYVTVRVAHTDWSQLNVWERSGFELMDVLVTFSRLTSTRLRKAPERGFAISELKPKDIPGVKVIARRSFIYDRFHADPVIPKRVSDNLHAQWVENECKGRAQQVLVARRAGKPVGFVTILLRGEGTNKKAVISLIAVSSAARGLGVGAALVNAAIRWASKQAKVLEVGTQARNVSAVRLYERLGFSVIGSSATLRKLL